MSGGLRTSTATILVLFILLIIILSVFLAEGNIGGC
ncbi:YjcZ family sporulation protein [Paenibacillus rhizoplanae]